jgi:hypothetical protein
VKNIDWKFVGTIVFENIIALAVMTYVAGCIVATSIHSANRVLSKLWVRLCVPLGKTSIETPVKPTLAATNPLFDLAAELEALTCVQLRELTGCKRRMKKAELVSLALITI